MCRDYANVEYYNNDLANTLKTNHMEMTFEPSWHHAPSPRRAIFAAPIPAVRGASSVKPHQSFSPSSGKPSSGPAVQSSFRGNPFASNTSSGTPFMSSSGNAQKLNFGNFLQRCKAVDSGMAVTATEQLRDNASVTSSRTLNAFQTTSNSSPFNFVSSAQRTTTDTNTSSTRMTSSQGLNTKEANTVSNTFPQTASKSQTVHNSDNNSLLNNISKGNSERALDSSNSITEIYHPPVVSVSSYVPTISGTAGSGPASVSTHREADSTLETETDTAQQQTGKNIAVKRKRKLMSGQLLDHVGNITEQAFSIVDM